jgi:outer membrane protein insertion porin family
MIPHSTFSNRFFAALLSIFFLFSVAAEVEAQNPKRLVEELVVQGNRRLRDDEIFSWLKTRAGKPYNEKQVLRDLQTLLESGVFDATETSVTIKEGAMGGVVVIFDVEELPLILDVTFKGLRGVEESDVIQALRENKVNLAKGEVYNPVKIRAAIRVIREFLASRGWSNADVTVHEEIGGTYASIEFLISDKQE